MSAKRETARAPKAMPLQDEPRLPAPKKACATAGSQGTEHIFAQTEALLPTPCTAHVYMVECADGTLYTGWTTDVAQRVAAHNAGHGAKYTRSRLPVCLRYSEECFDKRAALQREWALKRLTRAQKLALAARGNG